MSDFPVIPFSMAKVVTYCSLLPTVVMAWDQTQIMSTNWGPRTGSLHLRVPLTSVQKTHL